ncbi:hypothetical protein [Cerasicoccus maritimus]|uniref:hypothetical protein n=1 Tax=Cerasicoccus maritimus TaxID=490089 RepID=UPI002852D205|nr:hypothetical protein [Cerasicoccus maritimus]
MKPIHCTILALLLAPAFVHANLVVPRTKRINMLKEAQACLLKADPELKTDIADVRYPFEFEAKPVVVETKGEPVKEVVQEEITNEEILEKISPKIMPTGVLFKGGKGVLILPRGQLADGSAIRVNYGGKPYLIKVTDVTTGSFTLQLDDASLVRQIDAGAGRGVKRD